MSETTRPQFKREAYCQYCGGKLHLGYHFTCHICGDAYCYIHMARHSRAHAPRAVSENLYAK